MTAMTKERVRSSVPAMRHLRTTPWTEKAHKAILCCCSEGRLHGKPISKIPSLHRTLRLVTEESMKLATKLRHVDIHNHWLRQEHAEKRVLFQWTATKNMMADGLTKALPRQRHEGFIRLIRLDDITERLQQEKKMEDLRDRIIE